MARSRKPQPPRKGKGGAPREERRSAQRITRNITSAKGSRHPHPKEPIQTPRQSSPAPANAAAAPLRLQRGDYWLFGRHPVLAALGNPARELKRLLLAETPDAELARHAATLRLPLGPEVVGRAALDDLLPGTVHQGLALSVSPIPQIGLAGFLAELMDRPAVVVALDHVTDPHNVGAILRSAAAFGAAAVIATSDHAPDEGGLLAKAASGALEVVPYLMEVNLARALDQLKAAGFWCFGLGEEGEKVLRAKDAAPRTCLVLGAEGSGLRRLTRERCDLLVRLPTRPPISALNVSNAAAVALYELLGQSA
jgi:23S rRNA (guanosine2251-2'-O)-methyltransferase